jgi:gas vesicle protein
MKLLRASISVVALGLVVALAGGCGSLVDLSDLTNLQDGEDVLCEVCSASVQQKICVQLIVQPLMDIEGSDEDNGDENVQELILEATLEIQEVVDETVEEIYEVVDEAIEEMQEIANEAVKGDINAAMNTISTAEEVDEEDIVNEAIEKIEEIIRQAEHKISDIINDLEGKVGGEIEVIFSEYCVDTGIGRFCFDPLLVAGSGNGQK